MTANDVLSLFTNLASIRRSVCSASSVLYRIREWCKEVLIKNRIFILCTYRIFSSRKSLSIISWDMTNRLLSIISAHLAAACFEAPCLPVVWLEHRVIPTRTQAHSKDLDLERWVKSTRSWPCHNLTFCQHTVSITRRRSAPQARRRGRGALPRGHFSGRQLPAPGPSASAVRRGGWRKKSARARAMGGGGGGGGVGRRPGPVWEVCR